MSAIKFTLQRTSWTPDGIFGRFILNGDTFCHTLERAWEHNGKFVPLLVSGTYTLTRGIHKLETGPKFVTYAFPKFDSWDGKPHTGVLVHVGNWQKDSTGCVLVGERAGDLGGKPAVLQSKLAFGRFMDACGDNKTIEVEVR